MYEGKSFQICKHQVLQAYKLVKANHGAGGIDEVDFESYEENPKKTCTNYGIACHPGVTFQNQFEV